MHGIFSFLIPIESLDADDDTLKREVEASFEERFNDRLDSNNYYEQLYLFLPNGRFVELDGSCDDLEDPKELPQEKRYQWARLSALKCVAHDLGVRPEQEHDFDGLIAKIMTEVPPRLSALWAKGPLLGMETEGFRRERWGRQMELLTDSIRWREPPFTGAGTPYEYSAFDLTWDEGDEDHYAILLVDIHI